LDYFGRFSIQSLGIIYESLILSPNFGSKNGQKNRKINRSLNQQYSLMLFGVVTGPTLSLAKEQLIEALPYADGVEWRLDLLRERDVEKIKQIVQGWPKLTLFTYRGAPEEEVKKWLALSPDFFDIDLYEEKGLIQAFPSVRFILSAHDEERMPEDLDRLLESMRKIPAYAYKIAGRAHSTIDALKMLAFVARSQNVIGIAMGEEGQATRVLGPVVGNFIDYASLGDAPSAPGQISIRELCTTYRYHELKKGDPIYALIGDPICFSRSHETHNRLLTSLKQPGVYVKLKLDAQDLDAFYDLANQLPFKGMSVTMPLKKAMGRFLKEDGEKPINTLIIDRGAWTAANTDGWAAAELIEEQEQLQGKRCLILGAGGTAQAIALACKERGAKILLANRTKERAEAVAKEVDGTVYSLDALPNYDILIQATSVGMLQEGQMPIDPSQLLESRLVLDVISSFQETALLKAAKMKKCKTINGRTLFLKQAAGQFQKWLPMVTDARTLEQALQHLS
jgi:3-dehydroquinate dehydratase / shikimate dehydrogenase